MRYRLSTLLIAMIWVGLVCLALRSPSYLWSGILFAVVVLALLTSVLVAIYRPGPTRAMAVGFLIFTAGYLVVERGYWPGGAPGMSLPTGALAEWSFAVLHEDLDPINVTADEFQRRTAHKAIGVSSLAIVVGIIGGVIAQALCRSRSGDAQSPQS